MVRAAGRRDSGNPAPDALMNPLLHPLRPCFLALSFSYRDLGPTPPPRQPPAMAAHGKMPREGDAMTCALPSASPRFQADRTDAAQPCPRNDRIL